MNYFDYKSAAERYSTGRPYFHPQVIRRIKNYLSLIEPVERALDVGCGTGSSTLALREIAQQVVGVDRSAAMLAFVPRASGLGYVLAPAEQLPVRSEGAGLITISAAFHWLDRSAFLAEARRVLKSDGWVVVYSYAFSGKMVDNPDFESWMLDVYRSRYPKTPRAPVAFSSEDALRDGFLFLAQEEFSTPVQFTVETLIDYLVTHSNVIAAVEGGKERIEDVRRWLFESISPYFGGRAETTLLFRGPIWYLRKAA
jgi:ubiquinone/menaquinone biosynthesis C-methylase UbiE